MPEPKFEPATLRGFVYANAAAAAVAAEGDPASPAPAAAAAPNRPAFGAGDPKKDADAAAEPSGWKGVWECSAPCDGA